MNAIIEAEPWAADEHTSDEEVGLEGAELESVATPGAHSDAAPAPYYAELVLVRSGRRRVYRTFFHSLSQLGLHPRSQARLEGLVKRGGHLFIDPEGGQPICGEIRARVKPYPSYDEHQCIVIDQGFAATPREGVDAFARQKKVRAVLAHV